MLPHLVASYHIQEIKALIGMGLVARSPLKRFNGRPGSPLGCLDPAETPWVEELLAFSSCSCGCALSQMVFARQGLPKGLQQVSA